MTTTPRTQQIIEPGHYRAYLLRLWPSGTEWRASLEDVHTREVVGFDNLVDLCAFLEALKETRDDE